MTCPSPAPRRRLPTATVLGLLLAAALSTAVPPAALAQTATPPSSPPPSAAPAPVCSPTVSAALSTWDAGMATAERFGDRAVALAREKGREYLLPLLGVDPKAVQPQAGSGGTTDDLGKAVEDSRNSPERRAELCAAITAAVENARGTAGAGLDALKRALDDWRLMPTPAPTPSTPAPAPSGSAPDGTIKT
ncbi:hypothetical protein [Azospirillum sp. TSO35-2]|uniref:hypothetical protein n=1 Tax=Azospirillum sp. TSO35-2 TaxID=716796 RepID=UPI000D619341|nr:hypothetical protein [Azospirillum sp. TSO35-2]PWC38967.1 hypothetical protein TSO352_01560 [Azospirillum sp. TSO35-2]